MNTPVLIVGAGPTGLTLAIDLGLRGIPCTLIEQKEAPQFLPKMERCNARTMEIYRRMGLAEKIRAAGLPRHCPMDVFIVLSLIEPPLFHEKHPSVAEYEELIAKTNDGTRPLEPYQLISQYTLEPLLKSVAESLPSVSVRYGCELVSFAQDNGCVTAKVKDRNGAVSDITAQYMVGCDGGGSTVRRQLGIKLSGEGNLLQLRQALYYCEDLYERIPIGKGRHYHVADNQATFLIVQDSTKHFSLHAVVENDADMAAQFEQAVAMPVTYDMLYVGAWKQNLLLADRYQERPGFSRRRRGASGDSDRGPRHEYRRRRRHRPVVEARRHAARLGRAEAAGFLRIRAAAGRRSQCRRLNLRRARAQQMAFHVAAEYPR